MIFLGINNMHDASAAIVVDGRVMAAAEEERFTRKKHHIGFPVNAIKYCIAEVGISIKDVDVVGMSWRPWVLKTRFLNMLRMLPFSMRVFIAKAGRGSGQLGHALYALKLEWHL